ncbi:MAG: nitrogenase [Spirochaetales bacterium]|jgi:nitrogenase molybdenum-iron protein NifN|nr:nitrogenase [Spirochaetales bacterium]
MKSGAGVPVKSFVSTRNACKLCSPLGACFAFRGIEGCIPLIHGSQGCATYIRRYGISHFREPIDIASSNFTEAAAIFGGKDNLFTALDNVSRAYRPAAIGITSTCLSETIGEDVSMYLKQYETRRGQGLCDNAGHCPAIFYASTPSYRGTHVEGFHEAIYAAVRALISDGPAADQRRVKVPPRINLISGLLSAEDLRELHAILKSFAAPYTLLPDYSESLDGPSWAGYQKLPAGGTKADDIRSMKDAAGTLYLGFSSSPERDAGQWLASRFGVPLTHMDFPLGIENCDVFFESLSRLCEKPVPEFWTKQRGRLIDAYIDGHKYCNGKKAIIYGEEDFVVAIASFLDEIGVVPVAAATGAQSNSFAHRIRKALKNTRQQTLIMDKADFAGILEAVKGGGLEADFVMGHSKGLYLARNLGLPLLRCGFPVHDRIGGQRILHLGYKGTLNLFDLVCNTLMQARQEKFSSGYTYI